MAADLIRMWCEGHGARFNGTRCEWYRPLTKECRLLQEHELTEVFARGRCRPADLLRVVVASHLKVYRTMITPRDHIERIIFEVKTRLEHARLTKKLTLPALKTYLSRAAYHAVLQTLEEEGFALRYCGQCTYLSLTKPATCQRAAIVTGLGEIPNPGYGKTRYPSSRACADGFEPIRLPAGEDRPDESQRTLQIMVCADLLAERAASAASDAKSMYERQYVIFCRVVQWAEHERLGDAWKQDLAHSLGVSERTIERDLEQLIEFLEGALSHTA